MVATNLPVELKLCKDIERGKRIHAHSVETQTDSSVHVATALVKMYAKCGSMDDARQLFDSIKNPDVVLWTALISGYAENGESNTALNLLGRMRVLGCMPDSFTFVAALKACTSLAVEGDGRNKAECLELVRRIHSDIDSHWSIHVQNSLIDVYGNCGSMLDAQQVFDTLKKPDVVSWNALIKGYLDNGEGGTALDLFALMKSRGCKPNCRTFVSALKACSSLALEQDGSACLERGKRLHSEIGCHLDAYVQSTLVDMYAKCGSMVNARQVFDSMKHPNVVAWNALLLGYAVNGEGATALDMFATMRSQGYAPDSFTFVAALKGCISHPVEIQRLEWGRSLHSEIGCHCSIFVKNSLIDMYAKCGSMSEARQVFNSLNHPDLVSWNTLISGYADDGDGVTALDLFAKMRFQNCALNSVTFVAALKACTSMAMEGYRLECLELGKRIHLEIDCYSSIYVQTTLINMYAKCGSMIDAHQIFDSMYYPDVASWNALISGYTDNGEGVVALDLFARMKTQGCVPNSITFVAALKASCLLGALESGSKIHAEMDAETQRDIMLVTCLVDFYAKCGSMGQAQKVFDEHPSTRNLITWNALLAGYSRLGHNNVVFKLFEGMQDAGFQPDGATFLYILTCCSHAGLVDTAKDYFEEMVTNCAITGTVEHYTCMVDILGRSSKLDRAMLFLRTMPCTPTAVTWMAILGACRKWRNVGIGKLAFNSLVSLGEVTGSAYVLMAHIYGSWGMWEEQEMVLGMRTII